MSELQNDHFAPVPQPTDIAVASLFALLTTWNSGVAPTKFAEHLGLKIVNASDRNEIMAQYTCFFLAVAAVCAAALARAVPRQAALHGNFRRPAHWTLSQPFA